MKLLIAITKIKLRLNDFGINDDETKIKVFQLWINNSKDIENLIQIRNQKTPSIETFDQMVQFFSSYTKITSIKMYKEFAKIKRYNNQSNYDFALYITWLAALVFELDIHNTDYKELITSSINDCLESEVLQKILSSTAWLKETQTRIYSFQNWLDFIKYAHFSRTNEFNLKILDNSPTNNKKDKKVGGKRNRFNKERKGEKMNKKDKKESELTWNSCKIQHY